MRKLRRSTRAADDLEHIRRRLEQDHPDAAIKTIRTIYDGLRMLRKFPHRGRPGAQPGESD